MMHRPIIIEVNAQTAILLVLDGQMLLSITVVSQIVFHATGVTHLPITIQDNVHNAITQAVVGLILILIIVDLLIASHVIPMMLL